MNDYCLIEHMGEHGTYAWFNDIDDAKARPWVTGTSFQTILEYAGGRYQPPRTPFRNEWGKGGSEDTWHQVMNEQGRIPSQGEPFIGPPLFPLG